eukprot:1158483-Pelagomonas_calceolata.AAC.13
MRPASSVTFAVTFVRAAVEAKTQQHFKQEQEFEETVLTKTGTRIVEFRGASAPAFALAYRGTKKQRGLLVQVRHGSRKGDRHELSDKNILLEELAYLCTNKASFHTNAIIAYIQHCGNFNTLHLALSSQQTSRTCQNDTRVLLEGHLVMNPAMYFFIIAYHEVLYLQNETKRKAAGNLQRPLPWKCSKQNFNQCHLHLMGLKGWGDPDSHAASMIKITLRSFQGFLFKRNTKNISGQSSMGCVSYDEWAAVLH